MKVYPLVLLLSILGCGGNSSSSLGYANGDIDYEELLELPQSKQAHAPNEENSDFQKRKLVKTGGLAFESKNLQRDYKKIVSLLPVFGGYLENENQHKSARRINYDLTIRVPSKSYDSLYIHLSKIAVQLDHKYSNMEDVTGQYYDLQLRIRNKKSLEDRYIALLQKATAIRDIIDIERNLNQVRTDIERLEGQFKHLNKRVSYSTINITFYEVLPFSSSTNDRQNFKDRIFKAVSQGWYAFLSFIVGALTLWPFLIVLSVLVYLFRLWRKKRKLKK